MTIDKMRHYMGDQIFNHISSLNKIQCENMLKAVIQEISIAHYFQEGNRMFKLTAEKAYLEYRLETPKLFTLTPEAVYLKYVNDYLTVDLMAEHFAVCPHKLRQIIETGREHNAAHLSKKFGIKL